MLHLLPRILPYQVLTSRLIQLHSFQILSLLFTSVSMLASCMLCESWTLTAELQRRIQAMEMSCYREILLISCAKILQAIGLHEDLLTIVKRRKLQRYGHVLRSSGLAKTILQGSMEVGRRQGRQRKSLKDKIRE